MRRVATRLALFGAACVVLALAASGAGVSVATVRGVSMSPTLHDGDLVVVRSSGSYRAGDVVAYHSHRAGRVVLHRIVGRNGGRLVLRGDHNGWLDPEEATASDVVGRRIATVPRAGGVLSAVAGAVPGLRRSHRPERALVTHRGTLHWTRLPDRLDVGFTYRLDAVRATNVRGWAALTVEVAGPAGPPQRFVLRPTSPFTGARAELHGQLDLTHVGRAPATVTVLPTVAVDGLVAGRPMRQSYAPRCPLDPTAPGATMDARPVTMAVS